MHDHPALIFTALLLFLFGLFPRFSERWAVTGPMVFVVVGILASPLGFSLFEVNPDADIVKLLAEITLVMILFVDASMINRDVLLKSPSRLPMRLLLVGLPLTMLFGAVMGAVVFPEFGLWAIAMMAFILSPTDAALGQAVVKSRHVPDRIRQTISVESGLNDGIVLPPIFVCFAALSVEASQQDGNWIRFTAMQLTLGPIIGAAVGFVGGRMVEFSGQRDWMDGTFQRLTAFSLAIIAFATAELFHGNGFIAAFCAGLFLGVRSPEIRERIQEFGEAVAVKFSLFVFLMLGMVMVPFAFGYWGARELMYAVASLTIIRMIPVAISMIGAKVDWPTIAFIGWFGPRGIASVLYLLMAVATLGLGGFERIYSIIVLTVAISVIAHGISAVPLAKLYGRTANGEMTKDIPSDLGQTRS